MAVFNPKIVDASVRDVVFALSCEEKTDVLLYAMDRIASSPKCVAFIAPSRPALRIRYLSKEKRPAFSALALPR